MRRPMSNEAPAGSSLQHVPRPWLSAAFDLLDSASWTAKITTQAQTFPHKRMRIRRATVAGATKRGLLRRMSKEYQIVQEMDPNR